MGFSTVRGGSGFWCAIIGCIDIATDADGVSDVAGGAVDNAVYGHGCAARMASASTSTGQTAVTVCSGVCGVV